VISRQASEHLNLDYRVKIYDSKILVKAKLYNVNSLVKPIEFEIEKKKIKGVLYKH